MNWSYTHNDGEASATIVDHDGYTVAHISATQNTTAHEDLLGTLNLMCAAPDLLEALEAINEELCYGISDSLDALKDVATAAINKAKGGV